MRRFTRYRTASLYIASAALSLVLPFRVLHAQDENCEARDEFDALRGPSTRTTVTGRLVGPTGEPVSGAVVVSSAGGQAVSARDGSFALNVDVPAEAESLYLTAMVGVGGHQLSAQSLVSVRPNGSMTPAGTLSLLESASCNPSWLPTFGQAPGTDAAVYALAVFDDGSGPALYVGGGFTYAGGVQANCIAKWDGAVWSALGSGLDAGFTSADVLALAVFNDGSGAKLYVGGAFSKAGGVAANNIAKWNGSTWSPLGSGLDGSVHALTVASVGAGFALYAGGDFATAGAVAASRIAKWNGVVWSALGGGLTAGGSAPATAFALAPFDDGSGPALFVGGSFSFAGGVLANGIAKWNGSAWSALGSGVSSFNEVEALAAFDDGSGPALYAGGSFGSRSGTQASHIARWKGSSWTAVGNGVDGQVLALAIHDDGTGLALYAGGFYFTAGGALANGIAKWNGASWANLSSGVSESAVSAIATFDEGTGPSLFAGGDFTSAGGATTNHIAKWKASSWSGLGSGVGGIGGYALINATATYDDGSGPALFVGGNFAIAGDIPVSNIAKWNGLTWEPLGSGLGTPSFANVLALTVFNDGSGPKLCAGGSFTSAGGVSANNIASWDGSTWEALGDGLDGGAFALAAFDDGSGGVLFAGGTFTQAGGQPANYIARWDGIGWAPVGTGMANGVQGTWVQCLAVFDDGLGGGPGLYAGGSFTTAGTAWVNSIARWNGTAWSPLGVGMSGATYFEVSALASYDDGGAGPALYAGGSFTTAGSAIAKSIAKWNGASWSSLGSGMDGSVLSLVVHDDGGGGGSALYVGGSFTTAGGLAANHIARWDGSAWSALGSGMNGDVSTLAAFDDGTGNGASLFAGGTFTTTFDSGDSSLARWGCPSGAPAVWTDLGSGLAGSAGIPSLIGTGSLQVGSAGSLTLTSAKPLAVAAFFASLSSTPTPFKGGTLVPVPVLWLVTLATNGSGSLPLPWAAWPAGVPSGTTLYFQYGIQDPAAVKGVALSNALKAVTP